jgi:hypothetical protein
MAPFDASFGAGQNIVNTLLPELYKALAPTGLFTFDQTIGEAGFKSVSVDFTKSPTVDFTVCFMLSFAICICVMIN